MSSNSVDVSHIEVVQAIQNAENDPYTSVTTCGDVPDSKGVPLIAGKHTYVRVYFTNFKLSDSVVAEGKLQVHCGRKQVTLPGLQPVTWEKSDLPRLMDQRQIWSRSLNFELPSEVFKTAGKKRLELIELKDSQNQTIDLGVNDVTEVDFQCAYKLACRALVVRYRDVERQEYLEPSYEELDAVRRFLERAFPVAEVEWSTVRVEATREFRALNQVSRYTREQDETATIMLANLLRQIMAHRNQEVSAGWNDKTLYIGVLSDPNGRFGGVAMDSPIFPATHAVAACAADDEGWTAAHEIGHLLGRHHPGVPKLEVHGRDIGQSEIDCHARTEMGRFGHLSQYGTDEPEKVHLGLDVEPSAVAPVVLQHGRWFDLMTYRYPQWLSAYTYRRVYDRLRCIDALDLKCKPDVECWTAICSYNIDRKEGQILHVLPATYVTPQHSDGADSVSHMIVQNAIEHLLPLEVIVSPEQWKLIKTLFGPLLPPLATTATRRRGGSSSDPSNPVTLYNQGMEKVHHDNPDLGEVLTAHCVPQELRHPEIKMYTRYPDGDPGSTNIEQDAEVLWNAAEEVYYRRVGAYDRFSFGLFQVTVRSRPGKTLPASITLMIDGIVVDKFAQSVDDNEAEQIKDEIEKILGKTYGNDGGPTEKRDSYGAAPPTKKEDPCAPHQEPYPCDWPGLNSLVYDIEKDSYYLSFKWPDTLIDVDPSADGDEIAGTVTTTIQCQRPQPAHGRKQGKGGKAQVKWETVCVTDELSRRVWISPELFEEHNDCPKDYPCPDPQPKRRRSARKSSRPVHARTEDKLRFRVLITVGFRTFCPLGPYEAKPELLKPRRRHRFKPVDSDDDSCPDPPYTEYGNVPLPG